MCCADTPSRQQLHRSQNQKCSTAVVTRSRVRKAVRISCSSRHASAFRVAHDGVFTATISHRSSRFKFLGGRARCALKCSMHVCVFGLPGAVLLTRMIHALVLCRYPEWTPPSPVGHAARAAPAVSPPPPSPLLITPHTCPAARSLDRSPARSSRGN